MRRIWIVSSIFAGAVAGIILLLSFISTVSANNYLQQEPIDTVQPAHPEPAEGGELAAEELPQRELMADQAPSAADATLQVDVNFADEWVAGTTSTGAPVAVTLNDSGGSPKDDAMVTADGTTGEFFVSCDDWSSGGCPDIVPGDLITVSAAGVVYEFSPIQNIDISADEGTNVVSGSIPGEWTAGPLDVRCEVWEDPGPSAIDISVAKVDEKFEFDCDFDDVGWNLQKGQTVAVRYIEPDNNPNGNSVINILNWPWMRVNYAHDWVGADYDAGHPFWITVTDNTGAFKALATAYTEPHGGWSRSGFQTEGWHWVPEVPDIVPSDFVQFVADDGYANTIEVGTINGVLDIDTDEVNGTIAVPGVSISLTVECHPWGAWDMGIDAPGIVTWAEPDESVPFSCQWDPITEWDIQPGQDVAVSYQEPDLDLVIDVYRAPTADLYINKWSDGSPGEGGNLLYHIDYGNNGDGSAENVVISDTMDGVSYLSDTSGLAHTGSGTIPSPIVWDLGTLDPGGQGSFDLFVEVTAGQGTIISNTVWIDTSSYNQSDPWIPEATAENEVLANDTHLNIGINAWTGDPAPGEDTIYAVNVCNNGQTGSSEVTLDVELQPFNTLQSWVPQHPGWYEVGRTDTHLTVANPSLPSWNCSEVYVRAHLDPGVQPGEYLIVTATISAANDLETDDNETSWEGNAGEPHINIWIGKGLNWGSLVPNGLVDYYIDYGNNGNVPVGPVTITDTLPDGTVFLGAWHNDPYGGYEFVPDYVDDEIVVWNISGIENGQGTGFSVNLGIDSGAVPGDPLLNEVEISPLPGEDQYDDNVAQWLEEVYDFGPNLRISKHHNWNGDGQLGYNVLIENIGSEMVPEIWFTDTLPLGTTWDGGWDANWDWDRFIDFSHNAGELNWHYGEFYPGDSAWLWFNADLDEPGAPARWYTNTVEITIPPGDPSTWDNLTKDVAFSGPELRRVEFWINQDGQSSMWGEAVPGSHITITTPTGTFFTGAGPDCDGCWNVDDTGILNPGDIVEVRAGDGLLPVETTIPDPFAVDIDTAADEVFGQIGGWSEQKVEVYGDWEDGYQEVYTDLSGNFLAIYSDIPRGSEGYIRFVDEINYSEVIYHRPFHALDLVLDINYGHDWLESSYQVGHTLWVTVTESDQSTVKGVAELHSQYVPDWDWTGFSTNWEGWSGDHPDIQPGDWVFGRVDNSAEAQVQVGEIQIEFDTTNDVLYGQIVAPWLTGQLPVTCNIWDDQNGSTIYLDIPADPGTYDCDFGSEGWELGQGQSFEVRYLDPDDHQIINSVNWLTLRANIGPNSNGNRNVWGHNAGANETVTVILSTETGEFVAETIIQADDWGDFNTGDTLPENSLALWNWVDVSSSNGMTATMQIYPLYGEANVDTNVVTVTAAGPPFFWVDLNYCDQHGCDSYTMGDIGIDGTVTVDLMAERGFDVYPGSSYEANLHIWHDHQLYYLWNIPAPELGVWKWNTDGHARPDGFVVYNIQYRNEGNGPAEDVIIVDTLPDFTSYFGDTSGLPVAIEPSNTTITWDLGTVDPGTDVYFTVALEVDSGAPTGEETIEGNCVEILTTTEGDSNPDNNSQCAGPVGVWEDDVDLWVNKWAEPDDPAPGQEFYYQLQWCNQRGSAAGPVVLTDTLPLEVDLLDWWPATDPYWTEVSFDGQELVLYAPALPGNRCDNVTLRVLLDSAVPVGTRIENLVELHVPGDVNPDDNWQLDTNTFAGLPRYDLQVYKDFQYGSLTPGGFSAFYIIYYNNGNIASTIRVTDTLPSGFIYLDGEWHQDSPWSGQPFPDPDVNNNQLVWDLPAVEIGSWDGFNIRLGIDGGVTPDPELENCVDISGAGQDDHPGDNHNCAIFPVNPPGPNLKVSKEHWWNGNSQLQYQIRLENIGDQTIPDVWVTDTLPADTHWNGWWDGDLDWSRFIGDIIEDGGQLKWNFSELYPGDLFWLRFQADLDNPGQLMTFYTNTVEITVPPGDFNPLDNIFDDVAFSGAEIDWVDLNVYDNHLWGYANADPVVIETAYEQETFGAGDFDWYASQNFLPGEKVTITAGAGVNPVIIYIPDPFEVEGSSLTNQVWGQIDHLDSEWLEVELYDGPTLPVQTTSTGYFDVTFDDIPRGGQGEVRGSYQDGHTTVTMHGFWRSPDLFMDINYGHDWIEIGYEAGHTIWITVTESDSSTIKAVAELTSEYVPDWDWSGVMTGDEDWDPETPDIQPGDWVFGLVDSGYSAAVQVFTINGVVDVDNDEIGGSVIAPWYAGSVSFLDVRCDPWDAPGNVDSKHSTAAPDGSVSYLCSWDPAAEWDIDYDQNIGVYVRDPLGHFIVNGFSASRTPEQEIPLDPGWNMISSYVEPDDCDLGEVLDPIAGEYILLKNGYGQVYWPDQGIYDFTCWLPEQGYQIIMHSSQTLPLYGGTITPSSLSIHLLSGWSLTSYLRNNPMAIDVALGSIAGQLKLAKNGFGQVYWPEYSVDQIGDMVPGDGYRFYLTTEGWLTYPDN